MSTTKQNTRCHTITANRHYNKMVYNYICSNVVPNQNQINYFIYRRILKSQSFVMCLIRFTKMIFNCAIFLNFNFNPKLLAKTKLQLIVSSSSMLTRWPTHHQFFKKHFERCHRKPVCESLALHSDISTVFTNFSKPVRVTGVLAIQIEK